MRSSLCPMGMSNGWSSSRAAFWAVFGLSLATYILTLAPTVTLEFSGSMVTAADQLGVANPPGYPIWTLLAWFFQKVFGFLRYHGAPNPAWGVNFMSAFFGALSCGLAAWLVARVGRDRADRPTASLVGGILAGAALAFSPFLWSQSVVAEMVSLNVFSVMAFLALAYLGVSTGNGRFLYPLSALVGIGVLNSPTFVVLLPLYLALCLHLGRWRQIPALLGWFLLGFLPVVYLPIASAQNPPINWGYARTWEGFVHLVTRGQYERIVFAPLSALPGQLGSYARLLALQFPLPLIALALPSAVLLRSRQSRPWLLMLLLAFLMYSLVLTWGANPHPDRQTLFFVRVLWIPSYAILALLIGLGATVGLDFVSRRGRRAFAPAAVAVLLMSGAPLAAHFDPAFVRAFGGSGQRGHDFGWRFGHHQLEGYRGIVADLAPGERPPPDAGYPPPMETNAIFFGGTDPGRFVATYMIFCAKIRPDVYLLTQNALADRLYLNALRDLYGDTIWIPSQQDSHLAFQRYAEDIKAGRFPAGAAVSVENGRVSVQGVAGVMMINGILAQMIFEKNKHEHAFYVEESYVIPWMYPYLAPHGLIMKLQSEPLPELPPESVQNDRDFWDGYTARLLADPRFLRDVVARRSFSKLRSGIAGLYAYRKMFDEAEYAFRQAVALYPDSPEANFRLADLLLQRGRGAEAEAVIARLARADPGNMRIREFHEQIQRWTAKK